MNEKQKAKMVRNIVKARQIYVTGSAGYKAMAAH